MAKKPQSADDTGADPKTDEVVAVDATAGDEGGDPKTDEVAAVGAAVGVVQRRKVGRGSTRRINRALDAMTTALDAFKAEIDMQIYIVEEKPEDAPANWEPKRVAAHPLVQDLEQLKTELVKRVNDIIAPAAE